MAESAFIVPDSQIVTQNGSSFTNGGPRFLSDNANSIACWFSRKDCYNQSYEALMYCGVTPAYTNGKTHLYETGTPCTQDSQCTNNGHNKRDTSLGLCEGTALASTTTPKTTTKTTTKASTTTPKTVPTTTPLPVVACPQNYDGKTGMNNTWRGVVVSEFNLRRSQLAKGQLKMANGTYLPKGANINKLFYNCILESELKNAAITCNYSNITKYSVRISAFLDVTISMSLLYANFRDNLVLLFQIISC